MTAIVNVKNNRRKVELISGGISVDDRGTLVFNNCFDMEDVRRFYQVTNHRSDFIRAWHGHQLESKYVFVSKGAAIVATVAVDDWTDPDPHECVDRLILSARNPDVLLIPAGYAHGYKTLVPDTTLLFFSTATLEQSAKDDYRFDAYFWNPWGVTER